jgi:hypothetical protein
MEHINRVTNDEIVHVSGNEIFIFGSNLSGIHGAGAAKAAMKWGAVWGVGVGLRGNTYAIPTKSENIERTLTIDEITPYVNSFIDFANDNPNLRFYVTEIGCGLAKMSYDDIAPLFIKAIGVENVYLPQKFWDVLLKNTNDK